MRNGLFCIGVFLLSFISVSCKLVPPPEKKTAGDVLILPEFQKLALINPLLTFTTASARISEIIFDGLIRFDERFEPVPHLAESWELSKDEKTWTFHIRQGVRFHDGVEMTAEDVAFTFRKIKELGPKTPFFFMFQDVHTIQVKDRYTLEVSLKKPLASFLQTLDVGILPGHLLEEKDIRKATFNQHPIGTGPFRLKSWSETQVILEANGSYFLGRPYLDNVKVIVYPSREAAWAKLMAGEVDFAEFLTPDNYEILTQVPTFRIYSVPMPYYYLIAFNHERELFQDQRVRQALNYAVNKEEIVAKVLRGQGEIAAGTILPGSWAYNPDIKPYPYEPKKALTLFAEAGWIDRDGDHFLDNDGKPFEFKVHVNAGDDLKQKVFLLVQQQLLDIGIKMSLALVDAANAEVLVKRRFQAVFVELVSRGDPDFSYQLWHSSQIKNGFNWFSYRNDKVDRLLEEGRGEFDLERRKEIYFDCQEEILQDPPGIFLFWTNYLVGVHNRFKGVKISPVGPFENIREWHVPKDEQRHTKSDEPSSAEGK